MTTNREKPIIPIERMKPKIPLCFFASSLKYGKNRVGMFPAPREAKVANRKETLMSNLTKPICSFDRTSGNKKSVLR